jgi:hypothetical protein
VETGEWSSSFIGGSLGIPDIPERVHWDNAFALRTPADLLPPWTWGIN